MYTVLSRTCTRSCAERETRLPAVWVLLRKRAILPAIQGVVIVLLSAWPCQGQDWATRMFQATSHDFGTVARGAKAEYEFVLENLYVEDVHIAGVRSSCGCTTPEIERATLKTHEKGAIRATYNTASFVGPKGASLTVTFDKPFPAEVQLQVRGNIRGDLVVEPDQVDFGEVERGSAAEKTVTVTHFGGGDWRILDVRSDNPYLSVEATDVSRAAGQVTYRLSVRLNKDAPSGPVADHAMLITSDPQSAAVPLAVNAMVLTRIAVSPDSLFMGVLKPGQQVTRPLVIRAREPFRVTKISSDDPEFEVKSVDKSADTTLHVVPVTFVAEKAEGRVSGVIHIETSLGETRSVSAYAMIVEQ